MGAALERDTADVTLPGDPHPLGALHPITQIRREMEDILLGLGYRIADGPEVETEWHNFTALNTPPGHPAALAQRHLLHRRATPTGCCARRPRRCRCARCSAAGRRST